MSNRIDYNDVVKSAEIREIIHYLIDNTNITEENEKKIEIVLNILCNKLKNKLFNNVKKSCFKIEVFDGLYKVQNLHIEYTLNEFTFISLLKNPLKDLYRIFDEITVEASDNCLVLHCTMFSNCDNPAVLREICPSVYHDEKNDVYRVRYYIDDLEQRKMVNSLIEAILEEEEGGLDYGFY